MRVLHIGKFYPPFAGGMEYFLADLLAAQQRQGIQVAALVHDHRRLARVPDDAGGFPQPASIALYRVPCYGQLLYAPVSPGFPYRLARVLEDFKPDLLHLHMPNTSVFWVLASAAARRIPWVIHWQSDVVASQIERRLALAYRFYAPFERRLLAQSRAVIVASPAYLAASRALQTWRDKCHVIPLGLNPQRIRLPDKTALSEAEKLWREQGFRILSVGRLSYYKGHDVLIRAVAQNAALQLIIVGAGERAEALRALIRELGVGQRVVLAGFQPEARLNALFAGCDVLCLPSLERTEAFGLVLLESMFFRKPVVASDIPGSGVGWVVRQGGHGILTPPADPRALLDAFSRLRQSAQTRAALGEAGRRALDRQFHIRQIARQVTQLYRSIPGVPAPAAPAIE